MALAANSGCREADVSMGFVIAACSADDWAVVDGGCHAAADPKWTTGRLRVRQRDARAFPDLCAVVW